MWKTDGQTLPNDRGCAMHSIEWQKQKKSTTPSTQQLKFNREVMWCAVKLRNDNKITCHIAFIMPPTIWKVSIAFVRPSVCPSVAYIANNSRTQRPSVPKFGRKVLHLRWDSHNSFKVKWSKVRVRGGRGHTVSAEPGGHTACSETFCDSVEAVNRRDADLWQSRWKLVQCPARWQWCHCDEMNTSRWRLTRRTELRYSCVQRTALTARKHQHHRKTTSAYTAVQRH